MIPLRPRSDETFGCVAVNFYAVISKAEFPAVFGCLLKKMRKKKVWELTSNSFCHRFPL